MVNGSAVKWNVVELPALRVPESCVVFDRISKLQQKVYRLSPTVEMLVLQPISDNPKLPLIIHPHGGPNSAYVCEYFDYAALFALSGFAIASINYTGSVGYGENSIRALEGRIGDLDLSDTIWCKDELLKAGQYDERNVFLYGGSHGGFVCSWLSAKYPDMFRAACIINPVIDLPGKLSTLLDLWLCAGMLISSDIPDFAFGQLGIPYELAYPRPPNSEEIAKQHSHSPSSMVDHVKTPTLVLLGESDLRVPISQGLNWHSWLKARGVPTEYKIYQMYS